MNDLIVVRLERARDALAEAKTMQAAKKIADMAGAAETYARRQELGQEVIDYAHGLRVDALALLGTMIKTQKAGEGLNRGLAGSHVTGTTRVPVTDDRPTLASASITKKVSALAQKLADLPPVLFEQVRAGTMAVTAA